MLTDFMIAAVLLVVVGAAAAYLIKEKKRGVKCVGCPYADSCASKGACSSTGCSGSEHKKVI